VIVAGILRDASAGLTGAEQLELQRAAERVFERKREYLDALIRSQQAYFDKLTELDTTEQQLVNLTEEFISYIRERVLWIRTGKPLLLRQRGVLVPITWPEKGACAERRGAQRRGVEVLPPGIAPGSPA